MSGVNAYTATTNNELVWFINNLPIGSRILQVVSSNSENGYVVTYLNPMRKPNSFELVAHVPSSSVGMFHSDWLPSLLADLGNKVDLSLITYEHGIVYRFKGSVIKEGSNLIEICKQYDLTIVNS